MSDIFNGIRFLFNHYMGSIAMYSLRFYFPVIADQNVARTNVIPQSRGLVEYPLVPIFQMVDSKIT